MSEEIKDVVSTEVGEAVQYTGTPGVVEKLTKGSKGKKADKAVMATLNEWEASPMKGRTPQKVEEHPNGITAWHY